MQQCGQVVCDNCSKTQKFLESSRSGAAKRVCDKCAQGAGGGGDSDDSGGGKKTAPKSGAGAKAAAPAPSDGPVARRPAPGLPLIRMEDAVRARRGMGLRGAAPRKPPPVVVVIIISLSSAPPPARRSARCPSSPSWAGGR